MRGLLINYYVLVTLWDCTKIHREDYESASGGNSIFWTVNQVKDRWGHLTNNLAPPKSHVDAETFWKLWVDFPALAVNCQMIKKVSVSLASMAGLAAMHTNGRERSVRDFLTHCTNVRPGLHPGFYSVFGEVSVHKL